MTTAFLRAALLALLLLWPCGAPARAGDEPRTEKEIIVDGERVLSLEDGDDDAPLLRLGDRARGGYLGVHLIDITPDLRAHFGAPRDAGVLVAQVEGGTPAAKAGLQVGDVITKIDGGQVESSAELSRVVRRKKGGETITIEVQRNRSSKTLSATVEERQRRELDLGDLGKRLRSRDGVFRDFDFHRPLVGRLDNLEKLDQKLKDLEKRLGDLEKKLR